LPPDFTEWYNSTTVIASICAIILGMFMLSIGYRFYYVFLFVVGFVVAGGLLLIILVNYSKASMTAVIIAACLIGAIFGTVTLIVYWAGLFCAGAFCGLLLAALITSQIESVFVDWLLVLGLPLFAGLAVVVFQKFGVIVSSSFMGGYAIVAGIDWLAKGEGGLALFFPRLISGFKNIEPHWLTWFLVALNVVFGILGIWIQYRWSAKYYQHRPLIDFHFGQRVAEEEEGGISHNERDRRRRLFFEND